jgi:hypothetical protein
MAQQQRGVPQPDASAENRDVQHFAALDDYVAWKREQYGLVDYLAGDTSSFNPDPCWKHG